MLRQLAAWLLQGMIMAEMYMDQVARTVGRPIEEVRELNLYREGETSPYGQIISSSQVGHFSFQEQPCALGSRLECFEIEVGKACGVRCD